MDWLSRTVAHPVLLLIACAISAPVLFLYWRWIFGDLAGTVDDLKEAAVSDWVSIVRDRYWEGEWAKFKIAAFLLVSAAFVAAVYKVGVGLFF